MGKRRISLSTKRTAGSGDPFFAELGVGAGGCKCGIGRLVKAVGPESSSRTHERDYGCEVSSKTWTCAGRSSTIVDQ